EPCQLRSRGRPGRGRERRRSEHPDRLCEDQQYPASAPLRLPPSNASGLRRNHHRREEPDVPIRAAGLLHPGQERHGQMDEDPGYPAGHSPAGGGSRGPQAGRRVMRRVALTALAVALLSTARASAAPDFTALQAQPYESAKLAPLFTLPDLDGRAVSLEALRGKVVLLFFWATW